ncbi:MAG: PSD1 and planctomycete cytochrome C domain-containing protein [Verrucomicrobiota bacterium]
MTKQGAHRSTVWLWQIHLLLAAWLWLPSFWSFGGDTASDHEGVELFEKKIRPLLVERCYKCHSSTGDKIKGGLQMDSRDGMLQGGDTRAAIVPGDSARSLLIEAVSHANLDLQMPPKKKLADSEIADLTTWVNMGAPWPNNTAGAAAGKLPAFDLAKRREAHWAWQPIRPQTLPLVQDEHWPATEPDRFILAKLEEAGLKPATAADGRTLIRRAYFDLIGLPPSPAEVEAFLKDSSPKAYENVLDRLLASPQFGERWARHWLDLVRYAETLGHEFDFANFNAWRYRDYVIRAFNADVPYDQFVTEQIAGDLLATPRLDPAEGFNESVIGTGFYWMGQRVHSPVDVRAEESVVVDNQIDVTSKTFLGLTVACARCHDHKFDAISSKDYYSLFGVLGSSRYTQGSTYPRQKLLPQVAALASLKKELRPLIGHAWLQQASDVAEYLQTAAAVATRAHAELVSNPADAVATERHLNAARLNSWTKALQEKPAEAPGNPLFAWSALAADPQSNEPHFRDRLPAVLAALNASHPAALRTGDEIFAAFDGPDFAGWSVEGEAFGTAPAPVGDFAVGDMKQPVTTLLREPSASSAAISRRLEGVLRSSTFTIHKRYLHILLGGQHSRLNVRIDNFTMIVAPIYDSLRRMIDNEELSWITLDLDTWKGHRAYLEFNDLPTPDPTDTADHKYDSHAYVVVSRAVFSDQPQAPVDAIRPALVEGGELVRIGSAAELAILYQATTVKAVEAWCVGDCSKVSSSQIEWLNWMLRKHLLDIAPSDDPSNRELMAELARFQKLEEDLPEQQRVLAMIDGSPVDENVFIRGNHKSLGEVVPRRFLEALGGSEKNRFTNGSGRLELSQCMTDPSNPFLSRVMVNRIWQHLFGRGIVATPDDFGALGQAPTHPELLDWLADWYRTKGGWSNKKLIRLLMTSQVYRMSSNPADPGAEEKDPQDLLLHRMPLRRLEGEAIRDAILAVSGQMNPAMFGPPVPVFLTSFMDGRGRPGQSGPLDGAGRRSIYQEVRRNFIPPMMRAFDFPVPYTTIGRRTASNVPAQSLVLMNDPFVISEARAWAERLLANKQVTPEQRIALMYETIFSRPPVPDERLAAMDFLKQQALAYGLQPQQADTDPGLWADLCHVLMNVKEFIFLN